MSFYAFRLDTIHVLNPRGKIPDNDIVTFTVFVNQLDRGHGGGFFPAMAAGAVVPAAAVTPTTRSGMGLDWIIGPLEIAPGDVVTIAYSGFNTSDSELDLSGQDELILKTLDVIVSAAAGAPGGLVGSAVTTALGFIGDPVGKFIGFKKQGPCNGLVFSDTITFGGAGLDALSFRPPLPVHQNLPDASEVSFARAYTDETTHNSDICGEIAHSEITFSVLLLPFISVTYYASRLFPKHWVNGRSVPNLREGLRQLATSGTTVSIRSLLRLQP
jgi:hypothetical protein